MREELQSLLDAHERADSAFLNVPAAGLEECRDPGTNDLWVGRQIGTYQLVELIGAGGMGDVYRAIRSDAEFDKDVAIKLIRAGQESTFVVARFKTERQILAGLDHPNIARLLDGGRTTEGLPYIVMELVKGEPIDRYCDRNGLNVTARLELFLQICAAVQYAHGRLTIHRDLKPSNILVNAQGVPKLLDFGIAKIFEGVGELAEGSRTKSQVRLLTPDYASPEQLSGESITTATDVFSLGVLLYELLTGQTPFAEHGRHVANGGTTDPAWEPYKPSSVVRRSSVPNSESISARCEGSSLKLQRRLRGDLDNIVLMSLRVDPARRYASVERLADDIRRHLSARPVLARPDTLPYRTAKFILRYRVGVSVASMLTLGLLVGLVIALREARIAEAQRARAERRFTDVRELAHSLIFDIHDSIQDLPGATASRHLLVKTGLRYLDSLALEASGDVRLQRELAAAYERLGDVQGRGLEASEGDQAGAAQSYRKALGLRRDILAAQPNNVEVRGELVVNCGKLSDVLWVSGEPDEAMKFSQETVRNSFALTAADPTNRRFQLRYASSLLDYGYKLYKIRGDRGAAIGPIRDSLASLEGLHALDSSDRRVVRVLSLGYSRAAEIQAQDATTYLDALTLDQKAQDLVRPLAQEAPENADFAHLLAFTNYDLAAVLIKLRRLNEAEPHDIAALSTFQQLAVADPKVAEYHNAAVLALGDLGNIALLRGEPAQALKLLSDALREAQVVSKLDSSNVYFQVSAATQQSRLGDVYAALGARRSLKRNQLLLYCRMADSNYALAIRTLKNIKVNASPEATVEQNRLAKELGKCGGALAHTPTAVNGRAIAVHRATATL
jgi:non-specific serine/threonine protein kinase/serine/threonine-protein kinase